MPPYRRTRAQRRPISRRRPKADPSGDYAWEVFRKAENLKAGASATLEKKALQLTGGPSSPPAPQGRSIYGEASPDQAMELHDEGIEFHPLPVLPDERN